MATKTKDGAFNEFFWGPEFLSTKGFDVLVKRAHDGKALCKEMDNYLKQRSKMELEYSKNLTKLHQSVKFTGNIGQLEKAWNTFREEISRTAQIHKDCGQYFHQLSDETHKYIEEKSNKRKAAEDRTKKTQQSKATNYNRVVALKKAYNTKCQESDSASDTYSGLKNNVTVIPKELDKARQQADRCKEQVEKADQAYKTAIGVLETARMAWEDEMDKFCDIMQELEEDRIGFLRELMWTCANVDSKVAVDIDKSCESVRQELGTCDINADISTFVKQFQTGKVRPLQIVYENYYYNHYEN